MSNVHRIYNFNDVAQAREFLSGIEIPGAGKITRVWTTAGTQIEIKDMTDSQAVFYAMELARMLGIKEYGK